MPRRPACLLEQNRRTYYGLTKEAILSDEQLEALVKRSVKHSPNSFNMQQSRAVLLTGAAHEKLWDVVTEAWNKGQEDEGECNDTDYPRCVVEVPSW